MSNEGNLAQNLNYVFENFYDSRTVTGINYDSGSAMAKSYGSYGTGSGSVTLVFFSALASVTHQSHQGRFCFLVKDLTPEGCERKLQGQFGIEYREEPDTFILFEIQLFSLNSMVRLEDTSDLISFRCPTF